MVPMVARLVSWRQHCVDASSHKLVFVNYLIKNMIFLKIVVHKFESINK